MRSLLRITTTLGILGIFFLHSSLAFDIPKATGHIVDTAEMLTEDATFETQLSTLQKESGIEIAVVTIPTLKNELSIEEAAEKIFNTWKIGNAVKDNGVLLLISRDDRKFKIETGYGTEGTLPDITAKKILNGMTPFFKEGDYDAGVQFALGEILYAVNADPSLRTDPSSNKKGSEDTWLFVLFQVGAFAFIGLSSIFARTKSWYLGGVVGGGAGILGLLFFGFPWFLILVFAILGSIWDFLVSKEYQNKGSNSSWWAGGSGGFGGGGSSGGGFGGFGGGSSGGGGASGSW